MSDWNYGELINRRPHSHSVASNSTQPVERQDRCPSCGATRRYGFPQPEMYACGSWSDQKRTELCQEREAHNRTKEQLRNAREWIDPELCDDPLRREREAHNATKRERDEARQKCADWIRDFRALRTFARSLDEEANNLLRERDEARVQRDEQVRLTMQVDGLRVQAVHERDELREQNAKLRELAERAIERVGNECWRIKEVSNFWKGLRAELDQLKEGGK